MDFGYFTLSDNHYENNPRTPNQFVADITAEALYADQIGMHSAWIGEHHFNSLGVLSCPDLVLSYIASLRLMLPNVGADKRFDRLLISLIHSWRYKVDFFRSSLSSLYPVRNISLYNFTVVSTWFTLSWSSKPI